MDVLQTVCKSKTVLTTFSKTYIKYSYELRLARFKSLNLSTRQGLSPRKTVSKNSTVNKSKIVLKLDCPVNQFQKIEMDFGLKNFFLDFSVLTSELSTRTVLDLRLKEL